MQLDLTDDEAVALRELLDQHLSSMHSEISHTDNPEFRAQLNSRRDVLRGLRARLGGA